jgi:hypothetical protein
MFGLLCIGGYEADAVKDTRFPILRMRTIPWGPVARANPPRMDGPPGGWEGAFRRRTDGTDRFWREADIRRSGEVQKVPKD